MAESTLAVILISVWVGLVAAIGFLVWANPRDWLGRREAEEERAKKREADVADLDQVHEGEDRALEEEHALQGCERWIGRLVILSAVLVVLGLCGFCAFVALSDWHGLGLELLMRSIP